MNIWFYLLFPAFIAMICLADYVNDVINRRRRKRESNYGYYEDDTTLPAFLIGFGAFVGLIACIMCSVPRYNFNEIEYEYKNVPIESISLNSTVNGEFHTAFTIGYGYVEETPVYYFYEHDFGGLRLNAVSANHSVLIETDEAVPHVEIVDKIKFKDPSPMAKFFRTKKRLDRLANEGEDYYEKRRHTDGTIVWRNVPMNPKAVIKVYIPENTVKRQFNIDQANL